VHKIVANMKTLLHCERVTVYVHDSAASELVSFIATDIQGTIRIPLHRGLASLAFTTGKVVNTECAAAHSMFNAEVDRRTGFSTREVMACKFGTIGVVQCINKLSMTAFSKSDENKIAAMADLLKAVFGAAEDLGGIMLDADLNEICLQTVREGILQVNKEGLLMKANKFAGKVLGLSPERMAGASVIEVFEKSQELLIKFMQAVREGASASYKEQKLVVDGKFLVVDVSFILVNTQKSAGFYVIVLRPVLGLA
jgi:adenylate cyclase